MLTTDEEDGVPVWPDAELALLWATDDWEHCEAMELSSEEFLTKWVPGMTQDELMVIVCPVPAEEGEVITPKNSQNICKVIPMTWTAFKTRSTLSFKLNGRH